MRSLTMTLATAGLLLCAPAFAGQADKPMTSDDPDAMDVAKTPMTDLNINPDEIPKILLDAQREPYDLKGLGRCGPLITEVENLDALLGPDIDLPQEERDRISAGRLGKTIVGSFIPFRGLIREVSGAKDQERRIRVAVQAGFARRGFLKSVGQTKGCRYPARPATRKDVAEWIAEQRAEEMDKAQAKQQAKDAKQAKKAAKRNKD